MKNALSGSVGIIIPALTVCAPVKFSVLYEIIVKSSITSVKWNSGNHGLPQV